MYLSVQAATAVQRQHYLWCMLHCCMAISQSLSEGTVCTFFGLTNSAPNKCHTVPSYTFNDEANVMQHIQSRHEPTGAIQRDEGTPIPPFFLLPRVRQTFDTKQTVFDPSLVSSCLRSHRGVFCLWVPAVVNAVHVSVADSLLSGLQPLQQILDETTP